MGEVYRARDARLGRDVALKVLAPRLADNRDAVARFELEARSASALSHPHILHIYDIGTADGESGPVRYMVMELVDGDTLSKKIHDDSVALRDILEWLAQVADGLAKAHAANIVHRDLKPDNVMVSRDGYAKILDFGLAKLLETHDSTPDDRTVAMAAASPASTPGVILGTCSYMSPEQAQGKPTDARTDVFAFGCMLYEAATRRRAFEGASAVDTLHKVIYTEPDLTGLDEHLARIIRHCTAKRPDARYASIRDVALELRDLSRELESGSRPTTASTQTATRVSSGASRERTVAVLPFDDLSPARDNEYLAEGFAEEITSDLSKIALLRVISRSAVKKYRGEEKDIARVAAELNAEYVIDGSVRRAGSQLRITAQLVDARTVTQLWSEKYSGTLDDVFDIQEKVARSVVEQLKVKITPREDAALAQRPMTNVEAYECYLRARANVMRFDAEGLEVAMREIEKGLAIDPGNLHLLFARGYVDFQAYNIGIDPDPVRLERAAAIARTILEGDPNSTLGHRLRGLVALQQQDVRGGLEGLERALTGDPSDPDTLMWLCFLRPMVGRDTKAIVERLAAVDPYSPMAHAARGLPSLLEGRFDEAAVHLAKAREAVSIFAFIYMQALALGGRLDTIRALLVELEPHLGDFPFVPLATILGRAVTGDPAGARALINDDILRAARCDLQYCSWMAEIYAQLGERDLAIEWLEQSIARGFIIWPFFSKHDRLLDPVRDDPRFDALMEKARAGWESYQ
jgi:serine/threonine protein kinase/tetratricopeptide (TPR) repeat protein